jgi:hypothetical protein
MGTPGNEQGWETQMTMKEDSARMDLQKDFDQDDFPVGGGRPERSRQAPRPKLEATEAASAEMGREEYEQPSRPLRRQLQKLGGRGGGQGGKS